MSNDKEFYTPYWMQYSDITGDNNSALMLAQIEYWQGIKKNGWIVKSATDWWNELRLTSKQVKRIKAELEEFGYIETQLVYWGNSNTTGYKFKKDAVQKAISKGFNAYKNKPTQPKGTDTLGTDTLGTSTKGTDTLGTTVQVPKGLVHDTKRDHSITDITTENTTEITSFTETSSVVPSLFKSDLMQQALEDGIIKNQSAPSKPKKPKEELSQIDAEIRDKVKYIADNFKLWHEKNKEIVYRQKRSDFVKLTELFKDLCKKENHTFEKVIADLNLIVMGFSKLPHFYQSNFNLTYIATNYEKLLLEIKNPKPDPLPKPSFNEPVKHVPTKLHAYYNGYALPLGISTAQFEKLGELVYRDQVMDGQINEQQVSLYDFLEKYRGALKKITEEQLTQLMKDYEII